jgi:hypothetical protein
MAYFLLKCSVLVIVIIASTYVVALREIFSTSNTSSDTNPKYDSLNKNLDGNYHTTEDQIRLEEKHKINVMYVKGENGLPVGINMESTQNFPTYNTPGSFHYSPAAYVPSYEDSIILPLAETKKT